MPPNLPTGLRQEHVADATLARVQTALGIATQQARLCPLLNGKLFTKIPLLVGTAKDIQHGLGRAWVGYIVTQTYGPPGVCSVSTGNSSAAVNEADQTDPTRYLTLYASGNGYIDVWIF